jgi:putative transposase
LGYPVTTVLRIVGVLEATYYARKKREKEVEKPRVFNGGRPIPGYSVTKDGRRISDEQIKEWLLELVAGDGQAYGYRKLTIALEREHVLVINKKKVYRLCDELDLLRPQRQRQFKPPRKIAVNREITGSNQLWEMDIKYGYVEGEERFFFLLSLLDVFDREVIDYHIGRSCEARHAVELLQRCLWKRKLFEGNQRPVIRTDNGPQFISRAFAEACERFETEHERIPPKTPNKNAHIESFHAVLEDECLRRYEFQTYAEAYEAVSEYIQFYNERRIHGSLYDLSPVQFTEAMKAGTVRPLVVKV